MNTPMTTTMTNDEMKEASRKATEEGMRVIQEALAKRRIESDTESSDSDTSDSDSEASHGRILARYVKTKTRLNTLEGREHYRKLEISNLTVERDELKGILERVTNRMKVLEGIEKRMSIQTTKTKELESRMEQAFPWQVEGLFERYQKEMEQYHVQLTTLLDTLEQPEIRLCLSGCIENRKEHVKNIHMRLQIKKIMGYIDGWMRTLFMLGTLGFFGVSYAAIVYPSIGIRPVYWKICVAYVAILTVFYLYCRFIRH